MTRRRALAYSAIALAGVGIVWALVVVLPRRYTQDSGSPPPPVTSGERVTRKITARLFFVTEDGLHLVPMERDVVHGDGTVEQASRIIEAQLGPAPEPYTSAIPAGTKLQTLFVSGQGEAYVDLSAEVSSAHPGGSLNELLTIYTIVNVLTANLPAITAVQILIDGREVDTLAGHIDLRRPLQENVHWVAGAEAEPDVPNHESRIPPKSQP